VLYYVAENLAARRRVRAPHRVDDGRRAAAEREVERSIQRLYTYAAWADKYDGRCTTRRSAT
jgi:aldehyde dehydrogenase (NAD+)